MVEDTIAATKAPVSVIDDTLVSDGEVTSPHPIVGRETPASIGRYVVLGRLGAGAMGEVLAAYDPRLDRKVAIKRIHPGGAGVDAARVRLEREAQALARLKHRNVVAVHDVVIHQDSVFVAMEFVEGETLGKWMRRGEQRVRPWQEVVPVFEDVGAGLAAVHAVGLVHRDVKPGNVMIGSDGHVRVMDFGLARIDSDDQPEPSEILPSVSQVRPVELTQVGAVLGTPAYMAPEQFLGERATGRSDQFSFCIALHEALYGSRPFSGEDMVELSLAVLEGRMDPPPRETEGAVPAWLRAVILRGLERNPQDRFTDMDELLAALGTGELRRRRRRWLVAGLGLVALGLGAFGVQRWDLAQRERACEDQADIVDQDWNEDARAALRAGILATELSYAETTAERVLPWLDDYAERWRGQARVACTAATVPERGDERWDADTHARASWCLEQRRGALSSLIDRLSQAEAVDVQDAVAAAAALQPPSECTDERVLADMSAPPAEALRPQVLALQDRLAGAERFDEGEGIDHGALELAREVQVDARALPWMPLAVRSLRFEAKLLLAAGEVDEAEPLAGQAWAEAARAGLWSEATHTAAMIGSMLAAQGDREPEARLWLGNADIARAHASDPLGLLHSEVESGLARVERAADAFELGIEHGAAALADVEAAFGPEHPRVAGALHQLAEVYFAKGEFDEAEQLQLRALDIARRSHGADHPSVGQSLASLGAVLDAKGEREDAVEHFEQAIAIFELDALSRPALVKTLNRLALTLFDQAHYEDARPLVERALAIIEDTPTIPPQLEADTHNSLGLVYKGLGEYELASQEYEQALALEAEIFGPEHISVAQIHNNIAILLHQDGKIQACAERLQMAVDILERALGPNHPELVPTLSNLGLTLSNLDDFDGALAALERALAISERAVGPDNPAQASIFSRIGEVSAKTGDHLAAIAALERAVAVLAANEDGWGTQLARRRFDLGKMLWDAPVDQGRDRERARAVVEQARAGFAGLGKDDRAEACATWLAEHAEP